MPSCAPMPILDPAGDLSAVMRFLRRDPVLNTIPLGLLAENPEPEQRRGWFLATAERDGEITAVAFRTDFPKLGLLGEGDAASTRELAGVVHGRMPDLPCVMARDDLLAPFVEEWARLTGERGTPGMPERVHRLTSVRPQSAVPGSMRQASENDRELVLAWMRAFAADAGAVTLPGWAEQSTSAHLGRGSLFLWEDDGRASLAGGRETGSAVARLGPVYTPPSRRRRGYAGALVAQLSQRLLDGGCQACCLYTDLRNPTSNHVYAEVGYEPVADVNEVWFRQA